VDFGSTLRDWRIAADLSLRELARKVQIDFTQLSKIETGVLAPPTDDRIRDLVAALGRPSQDAEILIELAHQSIVPKQVLRAGLIKNPEVGALLRTLKGRRLSPDRANTLKKWATEEETHGPASG
jgi:PTS system nitrogen regulatory IIA component